MTNRLICSRATEELIKETWHNHPNLWFQSIPAAAREWLESDDLAGRWCVSTSAVSGQGIYFECLEDLVMYKMKWS
jgi:hypothetical protein